MSRGGTASFLVRLPEFFPVFCMFCTVEQSSICHFRQFCIVTKIIVEIQPGFVYNILIVVFVHPDSK